MPQFEDVGVLVKRGDGADGLGIEVRSIGALHQLVDERIGQVDVESLVDGGRSLGIGHLREIDDFLHRQRRKLLGHVKATALGQAVHDGLGEGHGCFNGSARVNITVRAKGGGAIDRVRHGSSFS